MRQFDGVVDGQEAQDAFDRLEHRDARRETDRVLELAVRAAIIAIDARDRRVFEPNVTVVQRERSRDEHCELPDLMVLVDDVEYLTADRARRRFETAQV